MSLDLHQPELAPSRRALPGLAFPGQVTDAERLGRRLAEHRDHPLVVALAERLGEDPATADLGDTRVAQPCTYVAGLVAAWEAVGVDAPVPMVLGHSLGEITAMAFAGAIEPMEGLNLVFALGEVGHVQYARRPSALVAVIGLDADAIEWARRHVVALTSGVLEPSGFNDPRQMVLCGDEAAVAAMVARVRAEVGSARVLRIRGAYHSSLMVEVLPQWRRAVQRVRFRVPRVPMLSSVDVCYRTGKAGLDELLLKWLVLPVRWHDATREAARLGVGALWDVGPGDVLRRIGGRNRMVDYVKKVGDFGQL